MFAGPNNGDLWPTLAELEKQGKPLGKHAPPPQTEFAEYEIELLLRPDRPPLTPKSLENWALELFWQIRAGVGSNGFGPGKITWVDLQAFERFTGLQLSAWQADLVMMVDRLFIAEYKAPEQN